MPRLTLTRRLRTRPDAALDAAVSAGGERAGGSVRVALPDFGTDDVITVDAHAAGDETRLELSAEYEVRLPYFAWAFAPLIRRAVRRTLAHTADAIEAAAEGRPAPAPPGPPAWAAPTPIPPRQAEVIATLCFLMAVAGYGGGLLTQTVDFVATTYDATDAQLGIVTAVTRVGTLVALVGSALADRMGRRRIVLGSVALVCAATAASALAPTLVTFAALQVLVRGGVNLAFTVALIAVTEEAPEGARAYTLALAGLAGSLGFVLGAIILPVADLAPGAWRAMYALSVGGLALLPTASKRLPETRRYVEVASRTAKRGRPGEIVDRTYGKRFWVVAAGGFLMNVFFAPSSQFTNRYLAREREFSGLGILVLRAVTQSIPAAVAVVAGGRLAESRGRKPMAVFGLVLTAVFGAVFFLTGGPVLWLCLLVSTAAVSLAGPALSAFTNELFPTEVRGTAAAGLLGIAVAGSVVGLLAAGWLARPLGSIGPAVALTAVAPLGVAAFLIRPLPEARGRNLDDVSPPEV